MQLPEEAVAEFQALCANKYGLRLDAREAETQARNFLQLAALATKNSHPFEI